MSSASDALVIDESEVVADVWIVGVVAILVVVCIVVERDLVKAEGEAEVIAVVDVCADVDVVASDGACGFSYGVVTLGVSIPLIVVDGDDSIAIGIVVDGGVIGGGEGVLAHGVELGCP